MAPEVFPCRPEEAELGTDGRVGGGKWQDLFFAPGPEGRRRCERGRSRQTPGGARRMHQQSGQVPDEALVADEPGSGAARRVTVCRIQVPF